MSSLSYTALDSESIQEGLDGKLSSTVGLENYYRLYLATYCFQTLLTYFQSGENMLTTFGNNMLPSINDNNDTDSKAGMGKDLADAAMSGFTNMQPTVSVSIGHGDVSYFSSNKMIVKSVESVYSEEWVKLDKYTQPVPMFVDITAQLELSQMAGLTDFANSGNVIRINFADVPNEKNENK